MTVPTLALVLPLCAAVACVWYFGMTWAWGRYLDPIFDRWLYRRYRNDLRRIGVDEPTFEEFCDEFIRPKAGAGVDRD